VRLEDYFDFLAPNDVRLKGTRVGIETILYDFLHRGRRPEEIVQSYPSLTLEQVYATVTYYLHNEAAVRVYLEEWLDFGRRMREEQARNPDAWSARVRELKARRLRASRGETTAATS
jgi:uncharacterized protein (DUF433 family)